MPKRRYTPEETVAKLCQLAVLVGQEKTVGEAVKTIGVTRTTYHRWRNEYSGLKLDKVKRLKELESENSRPRQLVNRSRRWPLHRWDRTSHYTNLASGSVLGGLVTGRKKNTRNFADTFS